MTKTLLTLLTCLLILSPNVVLGEQISGGLNCKIKDITILKMEEGLPKSYKGYNQGSNIGDNIRFSYQFRSPKYLSFKRTDEKLSHPEGFAFNGTFKPRDDDMRKIFPGHYFSENSRVTLSSELIEIEGYAGKELTLTRYYKNDWQGLMVAKTVQSVAVHSLDCRNTADPLDEILQYLKKLKY